MLPCGVNLFVDPIYGSEDIAMPKVVSEHVKRQQGHRNIYVLDRGLQSTRNMAAFSKESICFIARSKENRKYVELEQIPFTDSDLGSKSLVMNQYSVADSSLLRATISFKGSSTNSCR